MVEDDSTNDRSAPTRKQDSSEQPTAELSGVRPGLVIKDRYIIEKELGHGGIGAVYIARDRQLASRLVVIKFLLETVGQDPWFKKKFQLEMEALARIDHPGVVGVLDAGDTPEGKPFLVIQYIEGGNLRQALHREGADLGRTAEIVRQIGHALTAAHDKGVIHRDLKPENVMLQRLPDGEERVKLIDFGIATVKDSQAATNKETTHVAGTLAYMAPEQLMGKPTHQSDIYALGVIAYEMATGRVPFHTNAAARQFTMQQAGVAVKPKALRDDLPEAAQNVILRALAFEPAERYQRARDFGDDLFQALSAAAPSEAPVFATAAAGTLDNRTLEVAHVLFMDLVGYSKLATDSQTRALDQLQKLVRGTPEFQKAHAAKRLISLPTGDGMALVFFQDPVSPVQCALELARDLKDHPEIALRMGIHSGPVYRVADINANWNVAGGGINIAQRVMDCGDAGHILLSKNVADTLLQLTGWAPNLADLGVQQVKHGVQVHLFNLCANGAGNPLAPAKLRATKKKSVSRRAAILSISAVSLAGAGFGAYRWLAHRDESNSLAILPLVNLRKDQNLDYLSEGITENLINTLGKLPKLHVRSRSAVARFRNKPDVEPQAVGKALNVRTLLTGTIQQKDDRLIVPAELVDASNANHLWGQTYDRLVTEFTAIQEDIAQEVAARLLAQMSPGDKRILSKRYTDNPQAALLYQQGRFFWNKRTHEAIATSIDYFNRAIALDPNYALAYTGLADAYSLQSGSQPPKDVFPKAELAALKAVTRDDSLAEAHAALAFVKLHFDWDWLGAEKEYKRALELNPKYPSAHSMYGVYLMVRERFDEALQQMKRAQELDPISLPIAIGPARPLYVAGKFPEAIAYYRAALKLEPNFLPAHYGLGLVYEQQGKIAEAIAEYEKGPILPDDAGALSVQGHAYAVAGQKTKALAALSKLDGLAKKQYVSPYQGAAIYAGLGERDKMFEALEQCYDDRSWDIIFLKIDPAFHAFRDDSRFASLLKRLALAV